jgi:hypothetical protein
MSLEYDHHTLKIVKVRLAPQFLHAKSVFLNKIVEDVPWVRECVSYENLEFL